MGFEEGLVLGLVLYGLYVASRCFFRLEEGHVAVLTSFGEAEHEGKSVKTYGPGLHGKKPWQRVHAVSLMEQNLDLSGEEGGLRVMARDGSVVRCDSVLRFHVDEKGIERYLFSLRAPIEHITGLFRCLLRNEIAAFKRQGAEAAGDARSDALEHSSYALLVRERSRLNRAIEAYCRERIGDRFGISFSAVDLHDLLPPDELADSLNVVMHTQSEAEALLAKSRAECQQRVLSAGRGVMIAKAKATAAETEITRLGEHLSELEGRGTLEAYVARRRAEVLSEARATFMKRHA